MPSILTRPSSGGAGGNVDVNAYSDAGFTTPITSSDVGDTIYVRAENVSGITPVEYLFVFVDSSDNATVIYQGATANSSWVVIGDLGNGELYAFATEDAAEPKSWIGESSAFELTGFEGVLDAYPNNNVWAGGQIALRFAFSDPLIRYRRLSDNAEGDFSRITAVIPARITDNSILSNGSPSSNDGDLLSDFVSGTNAFSSVLRDQTTNGNNATQSTAASQPKVVNVGNLILGNSRPVLEFDGTDDHFELWTPNTVPPLPYHNLGTSITYVDWVYPTQLNSGGAFWFPQQTIIELLSSPVNGNIPLSVGFDGNKLKVGMADDSTSSFDAFTSTSTFSLNTWYKIAVTVNLNTVKIYVNGSLDSTHTITSATGDRTMGANNAYGWYGVRGAATPNQRFKGQTISPILKSEVLSDAEIADIHNNYYV